MGFARVIKNKSYFRRFQTKLRRRRECKTDYFARKRLVMQDKNKYKTPKYRLVVRFTNKDIVCQIFAPDVDHDICLASAYSHELRRYGITLGLTNFSAAYCVGLLLARRVNAKYKLEYEGTTEINGEEFHVEHAEGDSAGPFKALLDVGLKRTTTGSRLFGALKGACDGGLDVPHSNRRFPGTKMTEDGPEVDAEVTRKYIFGGHIADYMRQLAESDEEIYKARFGRYIKAGLDADKIEGLYKSAHTQIRANPNVKRNDKELGNFKARTGKKAEPVKKEWNHKKRSASQRMDRIKQKLLAKGKTSQAHTQPKMKQ